MWTCTSFTWKQNKTTTLVPGFSMSTAKAAESIISSHTEIYTLMLMQTLTATGHECMKLAMRYTHAIVYVLLQCTQGECFATSSALLLLTYMGYTPVCCLPYENASSCSLQQALHTICTWVATITITHARWNRSVYHNAMAVLRLSYTFFVKKILPYTLK